MFSSAAFAQTHPNPLSEPSDEMAAKRARTEVSAQSFDKINVESLSVKVVEMKDGNNMYITVSDHQEVQIIMHPVEPAIILRGFDMHGEVEKTKFNCKDKKSDTNKLSVYVLLDEAQAKFLDAATEKIKESLALEEGVVWSPLFKKGHSHDNDAVSIKVTLDGQPTNLTNIKIKNGDNAVAGAGWEFLKAQVPEHKAQGFTGAEMKAVVKLRPWKNGDKAGVELNATQLALKVVERKFVDLLADW
jgi:hypothetical protein